MLHKSLSDWLHEGVIMNKGVGSVDLDAWQATLVRGHAALGTYLFHSEVRTAVWDGDPCGGSGEVSDYALKYTVAHLAKMLAMADGAPNDGSEADGALLLGMTLSSGHVLHATSHKQQLPTVSGSSFAATIVCETLARCWRWLNGVRRKRASII